MTNELIITIVFNGKEISHRMNGVEINSLEQAEQQAKETIEKFIERYKLRGQMAEKVREDSFWNEETFQVSNEEERRSQSHSPELESLLKDYLKQANMDLKEATKLAKETIVGYYDLILALEYEGYSREQATMIVENSPRRSERLNLSVMVLGDKVYPEVNREIAQLKGFYFED
ncbi:hypothetical protein [Candidatus Enterococcus willemsii]|uniref:Uncharacterized protein n=1 Tax=Candidatus Enterococcus willemsii TaxID=1857215 RepID=A0ABQ6Z0L1_9ENTE|nr:hypothetical protein [Enterococcus sp. CU12B]KAF1304288.1 hypothetical protein BAU17_12805 [Enterococcus sp. CU12B]